MMRSGSTLHVKGLGLTLVSARKPLDGGLEIDELSEHAALQSPLAELGEETFNRIEPGRRFRRGPDRLTNQLAAHPIHSTCQVRRVVPRPCHAVTRRCPARTPEAGCPSTIRPLVGAFSLSTAACVSVKVGMSGAPFRPSMVIMGNT